MWKLLKGTSFIQVNNSKKAAESKVYYKMNQLKFGYIAVFNFLALKSRRTK
jgi:hypothetical protein